MLGSAADDQACAACGFFFPGGGSATNAFVVKISPGQSLCFYETLEKGAKMGVQFEVGSGGQLDIDFDVRESSTCPGSGARPG